MLAGFSSAAAAMLPSSAEAITNATVCRRQCLKPLLRLAAWLFSTRSVYLPGVVMVQPELPDSINVRRQIEHGFGANIKTASVSKRNSLLNSRLEQLQQLSQAVSV